MLEWIISNKEWVFSGIGGAIVVGGLTWVINLLFKKQHNGASTVQGLSASNIELVKLVDKLLSQLIDPIQQTKTRQISLYEHYVTPVYETFEEVHAAYIITFRKCRNSIKSLQHPFGIYSLIQTIEDDSLFTYHQRQKLIAFARSAKPEIMTGFMSAIIDYLQIPASDLFVESIEWPQNPIRQILHISNPVRSSIIDGLMALGRTIQQVNLARKERRNIRLFQARLDQLLENLQERYGRVVTEYISLKNKLLDTPD